MKKSLPSLPKLTRWVLLTGLLFLVMMTLMRFGLFFFFPNQGQSFAGVRKSFILGLRYDLRTCALIMVPTMVLAAIPALDPFRSNAARKLWLNIHGLVVFLMVFFYAIDFAHFSYLNQRLNASVLNYLEDTSISMGMVWQSYPVIRLILLVVLVAIGLGALLRIVYKTLNRSMRDFTRTVYSRKQRGWTFAIVFLLFGMLVFGRFNQFPLRWSDAFGLGNDYKANLALNPFESFFNSMKFRRSSYDEKKLRKVFPEVARLLGVTNVQDSTKKILSLAREAQPRQGALPSKTNVVLVICESFSGYKSSMWGNPLNTTPFFDSLSKQGLFYDRCFTPTYGTARGVWATITGIPDVEMPTTASRNPLAVNQRTIINEFRGHSKYYFLGGSSSWANIRGLLTNNIEGLKLYEENSYRSPRIDVWGISDKNLFLEANEVLAQEPGPFFAVIQTADNHRPYTIPEEDRKSFRSIDVPMDSVRKYGFESLAEFNAFRYTDYCFRSFMTAARKEKYFANTIFVFVGDHGIPGDATNILPKSWTEQRLANEHVPLLFYCQGKIAPMRSSQVCSQIDVLPTIAGFFDQPYTNTALGRDLRDPSFKDPFAFIFDPDYVQTGLVMGDYFLRFQYKTGQQEMVSVKNNGPVPDSVDRSKMHRIAESIHEVSKYLILNNRK